MKKVLLLTCCLVSLFFLNSCGFRYRDNAVRKVLSEQQRAWNYGDLDRFMEGYWNSDELVFISPGGVRYGYENTKNAYKKNYPDMTMMGNMEFEIMHVHNTGCRSAVVTGKWKLTRNHDVPQGYFMVVFRKMKGKWRIVADHTF